MSRQSTPGVGRFLVRLYPRAFRDRWGEELIAEVGNDGWRLVPAVVGMWLHPAVWPAASMVERRRRVAALAVIVSAAGCLTAHAVLELTGAVSRAMAHSWLLTACELTTILGFLLALPIPRRVGLVRLVAMAGRRLVVPTALGATVVVVANSERIAGQGLRVFVVGLWWFALGLAAMQAIRTVSDVSLELVEIPSTRRLGWGLWLAAGGIAASGLTILGPLLVGGGDRLASVLGGAPLLVLAAAVNGTVHDLAEVCSG
jgi:hypothetical protein